MTVKLTNSRGYDPMKRKAIAGGVVTPEATMLKQSSYNVFALKSYDEVVRLGLDKYFDQETWEAKKFREEAV